MSIQVSIGLALALTLALGCENETRGPTTAEFGAEREALKQKAGERPNKRKAPASSPVAQATADDEGGFAVVSKNYAYDSSGKRDPFRNYKWDRPDRLQDDGVDRGPLEQYDLTQLALVAVVWQTGNARALVHDPSGEAYIISEGARVGKNDGRVMSIDDNSIMVKETYVDFLGQKTTKDIEMQMRGSEGG